MQYLLHAPRHTTIFATSSGSIPCFLRRQHYWAGVKTERQELPEYISTSCIRELEDGTVEIDKNVFDGEQMAGESRSLLRRDGFVEPDMLYVWRLVRLRHEASVVDDSVEAVNTWDSDGSGG